MHGLHLQELRKFILKSTLITYTLTALVLIFASLPLVQGKVKPNPWYGVRLPETMDNPELWYKANKYGGQLMTIVGLLILAATIGAYFAPHISMLTYVEICGGVTTFGVLIAAFVIYRFVQKNK
jgi:uncharacterized membrane protein